MRFFIADFETNNFSYKATGLTEAQAVNELGAALAREAIEHSADDIYVTSWELGRAYRDFTDISEGASAFGKIRRTMLNWDDPGLGQLSPAAVTEQWEQGFGELAIFRDANNHCRVPGGYKTASGYALGGWVNRQRNAYNKNQLTPDRIQRLGDLGFVWDAHAEKWEQGFSELTIFKDEHSHCLVPATYKTLSRLLEMLAIPRLFAYFVLEV